MSWIGCSPEPSMLGRGGEMRNFLVKHKKKVLIGLGVGPVLIFFVVILALPRGEPVPVGALPTLTPEPTPETDAEPTPVSAVLAQVIPAVHEQYRQYRFSHFLYEYGVCFEGEFYLERLAGTEARFHTAEAEQLVLTDLSANVERLLEAYDTGACVERPDFSAHEGRGTWLRYWSARGEADAAQ